MPPEKISISDAQISLAASILLPEGKTFDPERIAFIKDLETLDLNAVPGSGKTTALMAKLIAIEQHLPFRDRAGILVLSHTNAAVDEIKKKIGHYCPRLFNYPNCISTIQSFTDTFLTIPYYKTLHHKRPVRIDNEIYDEHHYPDYGLKKLLAKRNDGDKVLYNYRLRDGDILNYELTETPFIFKKTSDTYQKILGIKKKIRDDGFLCFDDAYILAQEYLLKYPRIISVLNKRFKYVFVDEMQDMDRHQYELLETLFANGAVTYQRIGDKNQAIYNDESGIGDIWQERNLKELNCSHRLHPLVAEMVEPLALDPIQITGNKTNPDGTAIAIQPVMLVYTDASRHLVIPEFAAIIKGYADGGKINLKKDKVFKAIAWTTRQDGDAADKIRLNHYHPGFSKEQLRPQINYPCLESYLHYYDPGPACLASIRKNILNGLLKVFRLEAVFNPDNGRGFSKKTFMEYLKHHQPDVEQVFKLTLYKITKLVAENKIPQAHSLFKKLIKATFNKLGLPIANAASFIADKHTAGPLPAAHPAPVNVNQYVKDNITIDIATVHAVKGQTHTCTLYMESFYQKAVDNKGQYESSRIAEQLQGLPLPADAHDFIRQTLKMAYVGFSRPTHLLAFAIHKSRYDSHYAGKPGIDKWDVQFVNAGE